MTGCKKIDMDTWARREHYEYYTKQLKVEYNITANVDVKNVLDFCHSKGYKFYPAMIYLVTKTLNRIDNFKMFKDKYGYLCAWDKIIPNYTVFHNDDHTFSAMLLILTHQYNWEKRRFAIRDSAAITGKCCPWRAGYAVKISRLSFFCFNSFFRCGSSHIF